MLQPIVHDGSCFIKKDSGKGLHNVWTASSRCNKKLI